MATYIMALSITPGSKKSNPERSRLINESLEVFSQESVTVNELFATLGRFDFIVKFETENQQLVFKIASEINKLGILDTETWPVIPFNDFSEILDSEL